MLRYGATDLRQYRWRSRACDILYTNFCEGLRQCGQNNPTNLTPITSCRTVLTMVMPGILSSVKANWCANPIRACRSRSQRMNFAGSTWRSAVNTFWVIIRAVPVLPCLPAAHRVRDLPPWACGDCWDVPSNHCSTLPAVHSRLSIGMKPTSSVAVVAKRCRITFRIALNTVINAG